MLKCGCSCKFSIVAVAVAQPVKQGRSHQLCFSLGQRAGKGAEAGGSGGNPGASPPAAGPEPISGLAVPVPAWAVTLPQGLLGTQEPLDTQLLKTAALSSQALP